MSTLRDQMLKKPREPGRGLWGGYTYEAARRQARKGGGVPICYRMSSAPDIEWAVATGMRGSKRSGLELMIITPTGPGWMPAKDCFFTEEQCRKHHRMPPRDYDEKLKALAARASKLDEDLLELAEQMKEPSDG